ncbi:MAG: T9SS type A sorting domain-containing protein [Bacteroidota bacterium]
MKKTKLVLAFCALVAFGAFHKGYAQMSANVDEPTVKPSEISKNRIGRTDRDALRVIFLAGSDYTNFRIGMENESKSAVTIEVTDEKGNIVYTDHRKKVYKRVKEIDFSFLKRGEYVVRVFNDNNEFSKVLLVP